MTDELRDTEAKRSTEYRQELETVGDRGWYLRGEYEAYAELFDLNVARAPFVVFGAPQFAQRAILTVQIETLRDTTSRRKLLDVFVEGLADSKLKKFQRDGVFDDRSMLDLQSYLDRLELDIYKILRPRSKKVPRSRIVRILPPSNERPIRPEIETVLRWRNTEPGGLWLKATSRGEITAEHEFRIRSSRVTKQQILMEDLLNDYEKEEPAPLAHFIDRAYSNELNAASSRRRGISDSLPKTRTLFSNTAQTLTDAGFPQGIIPKLGRDVDEGYRVRLSVAAVLDDSPRSRLKLDYVGDMNDCADLDAAQADSEGRILGPRARNLRRPRPD